MRVTRHAGKAFELEMLEPRLLLSAAAAAPVAPIVDALGTSGHQVQNDTPATTSGNIAYDPATQIDDIFSNADASETIQPAPAPETNSEQSASETEVQIPSSNENRSDAQPTVPSSATDSQSVTEQLTQTLRAANSPPGTETHLTRDT